MHGLVEVVANGRGDDRLHTELRYRDTEAGRIAMASLAELLASLPSAMPLHVVDRSIVFAS